MLASLSSLALPQKIHIPDRLTRVQLLFTRNPSPLQSSKFPFEYLLLPPRSALEAVPRRGYGFRLPWPPSCCLDELTPFVVHFNSTFGSSRIAKDLIHFQSSSFAPIPKFDDRFARQNRYELPSEFPLTSPYSGIVHHLSGLCKCALTQNFQENPVRSMLHLADHTYVYFHFALGFDTQRLAHL
ncbi:hypothetical protein BCR33DRAFT_753447 [Rhizoclosmatium globosum]|uniref:Uncharacterized protein n=1 Tax=Rhizoclosmatium globosum TaxID=329046 RepID=A0A1Y2CKL0_9FUNG|nr:hypothetical protein BCR33DRAFT_753447 [Rhizoclosmatium globosum]|eukprot:ORY47497.1 hypothetical protein BCR33DRAFT_753447 [Rhizoclosmatium globosum]